MKPRIKIAVDAAMILILLLLMAYERVGQAAHEWLGAGIFLLYFLHHFLNRGWHKNLLCGRYTPLRTMQTLLALLLCAAALGSMWSGIILSRHVFAFLPISGGRSAARVAHMVCGYWGFVLMLMHLGFHWGIMLNFLEKHLKVDPEKRKWFCRLAVLLAAGYGLIAFWRRALGTYMLLQSHFVFFDFEEPLALFFADYIAVMALFAAAGYYLAKALKYLGTMKSSSNHGR